MELGIENLKDGLEVVSFMATLIGGIAILFAVRDYSINRKQLNLSALESCISRYREKFLMMNNQSSEQLVTEYIDLVNEELFYFEHQFLPKQVAEEWLDGMIDHLPLYDYAGNMLNGGYCLEIIPQRRLLEQYRFKRVRRIFTVKPSHEMSVIYGDVNRALKEKSRSRLIKEMIRNLDKL